MLRCRLWKNKMLKLKLSNGQERDVAKGSNLLALAQVNNAFAARADNVCRVVCGLPVYYKGGEKL